MHNVCLYAGVCFTFSMGNLANNLFALNHIKKKEEKSNNRNTVIVIVIIVTYYYGWENVQAKLVYHQL